MRLPKSVILIFDIRLQETARKAIWDLLKVRNDTELPAAVTKHHSYVNADEVESYKQGILQPTLRPFRPYWDEISGGYNKALVSLFVTHIQEMHPGKWTTEDLRLYTFQRLTTMKTRLTKTLPRGGETPDEARARYEMMNGNSRAISRSNKRCLDVSSSSYLCRWSLMTCLLDQKRQARYCDEESRSGVS